MPHPDGRETAQERHFQKMRGPLGFHFLAGPSPLPGHKVPRELARALWARGYDVSVEVEDTGQTGWGRTSIRHLEGMVKQPFCLVSYGPALKDYVGNPRIQIESTDTGHHEDPRHIQYINDRVDLLIVPRVCTKAAFEQAGVTIPVEVVQWGVDLNVYQPWPRDEALLEKVVWPKGKRRGDKLFLALGRTDQRYGLTQAMQSFRAASANGLDGSLLIVQDPYSYHEDVTDLVAEAAPDDFPVGIVTGLDEWSMARLLSMVSGMPWCAETDAWRLLESELICASGSMDEAQRVVLNWDGSAASLIGAVREHITKPDILSTNDDDLWKRANGIQPSDFLASGERNRVAAKRTWRIDAEGQALAAAYDQAQLEFWWSDYIAHLRAVGEA